MNLYLFPNGEVRPCCRHAAPYGRIGRHGLLELWEGLRRRSLVERLAKQDYSGGCVGCGHEVAIEGRSNAYPSTFDPFVTGYSSDSGVGEWPTRIEFNLSNTCNLQCVQCNGDLSSSIRIHREQRPPLESPYDDRFFDELSRFIPHLRWTQFAGGEPFLAPENFRVWELIAELNPDLECVAVTNATQWNDRIESIIHRLGMGFVFSIDGITKETYEAIRIGARFEEVLANVERFRAAAARSGAPVSINHCLMRQNYSEFGDLLLFAEERGIRVDVSVVRDPPDASLATLPRESLRQAHDVLLVQERRLAGLLELNAGVWRTEVDRIGMWAQADAGSLDEATAAWVTTRVTLLPRIMGFPVRSDRVSDDVEARAELGELAHDGVVHAMSVDQRDVVVDLSPSLCDLLALPAAQILGAPADSVRDKALATFGEMRSFDVLSGDDHRVDAVAVFDTASVRVALVAIRAADGRARQVRVLIAVE